jgi:uncharacterized protein
MPDTAERIVIPAREGRSLHVPAGRSFRVTDREGGQVGDLFAFNAEDVSAYASVARSSTGSSRASGSRS